MMEAMISHEGCRVSTILSAYKDKSVGESIILPTIKNFSKQTQHYNTTVSQLTYNIQNQISQQRNQQNEINKGLTQTLQKLMQNLDIQSSSSRSRMEFNQNPSCSPPGFNHNTMS